MKEVFKKMIEFAGYKTITREHYLKLQEGPYVPDLDFTYLVKKIIDKNATLVCLDIGANVGQTTQKFKTYFPNSRVFAFEPIKETFLLMAKYTSHLDNVTILNEAMGSKIGEMKVFHRTDSVLNSLVEELNQYAKTTGANSEIVKINTVDAFKSEHNISKIHILKSDTEGFELEVLRGAKTSLESQDIEMVYVEVGFEKEDKQHTYWVEVVEYLLAYNYSFCGLFEVAYGLNLKAYYANALFMSEKKLEENKALNS